MDSMSRPAMILVAGRSIGLAASFAIGIVLARLFEPSLFGTYKQFFLVYATLFGLMQLGMAESLYYFVPRQAGRTGRYVCNAMVTLALAGAACTAALYAARAPIAEWLSNPLLADYILPLGLFLTFTLTSTVLEIVMISRKRHVTAAITYAVSDIVRTSLFILPALAFASLRSVFIGATIFAAVRLAATVGMLWREFGRDFRLDPALLRQQLAYALPFATAVGIEVILINYHQYVVASRVDAATFAIYAIGCLQIPLYDLIVTSTVNVLMVRMAGDNSRGRAALALWHDTVCRLAFLIVPLVIFLLVTSHYLIVGLFTATYAASVPIFMVWVLTMLPAVMAVDAVLRVYAQTRFLLVMNVVRFICVAGLIGWFISGFGLIGAVVVTLLAMAVTKALGVLRIIRLMGVGLREALPWSGLGLIAARAGAAAVPVVWVQNRLDMHPLLVFAIGAAVYGAVYALLSFWRELIDRFTSADRRAALYGPSAEKSGAA